MRNPKQVLYRITTKVKPAEPALSVDELKAELTISGSGFDSQLAAWIGEATENLELAAGVVLIDTTYVEYLDYWPLTASHWGELHRGPVDSITSIKYTDSNGDEQTWDSSNYVVDNIASPCRIGLASGGSIPSHIDEINAVWIEYVAGYGEAADVPEVAKEYLRIFCRPRYERRAPVDAESMREQAIISELMYAL